MLQTEFILFGSLQITLNLVNKVMQSDMFPRICPEGNVCLIHPCVYYPLCALFQSFLRLEAAFVSLHGLYQQGLKKNKNQTVIPIFSHETHSQTLPSGVKTPLYKQTWYCTDAQIVCRQRHVWKQFECSSVFAPPQKHETRAREECLVNRGQLREGACEKEEGQVPSKKTKKKKNCFFSLNITFLSPPDSLSNCRTFTYHPEETKCWPNTLLST